MKIYTYKNIPSNTQNIHTSCSIECRVNLVKTNREYNKIVYLNWRNSFGTLRDNNLQTISPHLFL